MHYDVCIYRAIIYHAAHNRMIKIIYQLTFNGKLIMLNDYFVNSVIVTRQDTTILKVVIVVIVKNQ